MKIAKDAWRAKLPLPATDKWPNGVWDIEAFRHGTMSLLFFAPEEKDYQSPHDQDELYIVVKGSGVLMIEETPYPFEPGDVLFVPAGKEHRFQPPLKDLQFWVVLYGKTGGEHPG
jgi:mannose-6-phosphate isomerase-like protein (cupin superfamily)